MKFIYNPIKFFTDRYYRNAEMVSYWKNKDAVMAKVVVAPEGHYVMQMDGEKYPFPGYPRGTLLFGTKPGEHSLFSQLKHQIKNQIFNYIWYSLDEGKSREEIMEHLEKVSLPILHDIMEKSKYDLVPFEKLVPPMKEFNRAFDVVIQNTNSEKALKLKEILTFIFQEDDAYRMRFQWMAKFFNPNSLLNRFKDPTKLFENAMKMLEEAEMIGDMKGRQRLWRRGLMFLLEDEGFRECFLLLVKEIDWKKMMLTKADKYFFRAKYFKVDYPHYQY